MTDIEKKALALLNEVWADRGRNVTLDRFSRDSFAISEALCRAIERHEAFRQEVSEALLWHCKYTDGVLEGLQHLIIADPDPLEEALRDAAFEQQQTSAGEVPEWALERVYELWQDTSLLEAFARYIAAHEPKGEVPKLLTEAEWRELLSTAWVDPDEKLPELRERDLIAPEPEPDALLAEELAAVKAREAKLRACLGFFASVIKSGEPWTATCEQRYRAALQEKQT